MTSEGSKAFSITRPTEAHREAIRSGWTDGSLKKRIGKGTCWFRVVRADTPRQAAHYATHAFASVKPARFSPVADRRGAPIATAYAGDSMRVALWETVLRRVRHDGIKRVPVHESLGRFLVQVRLREDCEAIDLTRPSISRLALSGGRAPELAAAWPDAYGITRSWAQCIVEEAPEARGLHYESHQLGGCCLMLFGDPKESLFRRVGPVMPVNAGQVRQILLAEADRAGVSIDFGEDEDPSSED